MSERRKHQLLWIVGLVLIVCWTSFFVGAATSRFVQTFEGQQRAKSQMVASVVQRFIHDGPIARITDLWDDDYEKIEQIMAQARWGTREPIAAYRTIYSGNPYVQKLADRIISSAEADPAIAAVAVVDRNGFVPWGWSRTDTWRALERRPMAASLLTEIRMAGGSLMYEGDTEDIFLAASPIRMEGIVWGYVVIGFYPLENNDLIALAANSITGVFTVTTLIVLTLPTINYWRRRRGRCF